MNCFLGIDGGGTKTAYLLMDQEGRVLYETVGQGTSYRQHGIARVVETLEETAGQCLLRAGLSQADLAGVCIGLPCYGENPGIDAEITTELGKRFDPRAMYLTNDVEVAWAGSLACKSGINLVAGTGSIAFGRDDKNETARCGGWSEHFSDEGSCYWAARKAMELFTKQADGRCAQGALYRLVREELALSDDFEFVTVMERDYLPFRDKTAAFQKVLCAAAEQGDQAAIAIYGQTAIELAAMASALKRKLHFAQSPVAVSCSGGIFHAGSLVLEPLETLLLQEGMELHTPILSPVKGAALLAVQRFSPEQFPDICQKLVQQ